MAKVNTKYTKCPPDDVGYEQNCPLKKALKMLFNDHPGNYKLNNVEFKDKMTNVDPKGNIQVYGTISLDIEILAEYYFDMRGKLKKYR